MTSQVQKFNSLADYSAELGRICFDRWREYRLKQITEKRQAQDKQPPKWKI